MNMMFAYIDPFTGSLLLQILAMGFMSVLIFFKKVKSFVLRIFGAKTETLVEHDDIASIKLREKTNDQEKKAA